MLCCILAALAASPLLWLSALRQRPCCGPRLLPLTLAGLSLLAGMGLIGVVLFTSSGASAFRHICSVAGWSVRAN